MGEGHERLIDTETGEPQFSQQKSGIFPLHILSSLQTQRDYMLTAQVFGLGDVVSCLGTRGKQRF